MSEETIKVLIQTTINSTIENANLLIYDRCATIISVLAIVISIWAVFRNELKQYNNKFYDKILGSELQEQLPLLLNNALDLENKRVNEESFSKLEEFIGELRKKILVFKYNNEKFYNSINKALIDIDEKMIIMTNRSENFQIKYLDLLKSIKKLYRVCKKYIA